MDFNLKNNVCVFTIHPTRDVRVFYRQCRSLKKLGLNVTLIAISEDGYYKDVVEGINVIGIPRWKSIKQRIKTYFKIASLAYKQKADVYHFHDPDFLLFAVFLRLITFKPFVYDIHEFYYKQFPQKFPDKWPVRQIVGGVVKFIESVLGMLCGSVSAVNVKMVKRFSRLGCRTVLTPNYASPEDYDPAPVSDEQWASRRYTVIHSGTLSPGRGSLVLLEVARKLKEIRPEVQVITTRRFWSKQQEEVLLEKMALPEYQNTLKMVPHLSGDELPKFICGAGVGLSLLQFSGQYDQPETVPSKFFEYMSQSVPIVASNMPSSYAYVENENAGLIVQADKPDEYVDAILKIIDDPEFAKATGENGRQAFVNKYNWGICEENLGEFYSGMLKK